MNQLVVAALLVAAGGAFGACLRYLTNHAVQSRHETRWPFGTFAVNTIGCLVLGLVAGGAARGAPGWVVTFLGTGVCGALTTFSTFSHETLELLEDGNHQHAAVTVVIGVTAGMAACFGGYALGTALF